MNHTKTVKMEASIPSPSLWRLGTLSEQLEEKLEESQGTARDATITVERHVSPLRGKRWVIHNWELVRICVGILRGSNWGLFLGCFIILKFFLYDYVKDFYSPWIKKYSCIICCALNNTSVINSYIRIMKLWLELYIRDKSNIWWIVE